MAATFRPFDALGALPGTGRDPASVRTRITALEHLLEGLFVVPGTKFRVGLDPIIDLLPVAGSVVGGIMGSYLLWEARNLGMSKWTMARMAANVGIDTVVGAVPLLGTVFDVFFKSNTMNLRLIKRHLDRHHPASAVVTVTPA